MLPGTIVHFAGSAVPTGWLPCDGAAISRTTYAALFSAIGTTYGAGNGSTTFNVPDLRGRSLLGSGTGAGLTARARGDVGGEETHILTVGELALHNHGLSRVSDADQSGGGSYVTGDGTDTLTATAGSDTPHNTMHPFGVAHAMIKI